MSGLLPRVPPDSGAGSSGVFGNLVVDNLVVNQVAAINILNVSGASTFSGPSTFTSTITVTSANPDSIAIFDASRRLSSTATLTNGQIAIGSTGLPPVAGSIAATALQTTVTPGPGSITIGTVQNIATTSSPTFANMTLTTALTFTGGVRIGGSGVAAGASGSASVVVGGNATAANGATALGQASSASAGGSVAVGFGASAGGAGSAIAAGQASSAQGFEGMALGFTASDGGFTNSSAVGAFATATAAHQVMLGTTAETVTAPGSLVMPTVVATNATAGFLRISTTAGTPTGAATDASLVYDSTNDIFYGRINGVWQAFATAATDTLAQVLIAGNTTGANDINVSDPQQILFISGIRIGGNGVAVGATDTQGISIGEGASASGGESTSIGTGSSSAGDKSVCVGGGSASPGSGSTALGFNVSSAGDDSVAVGISAMASAASDVSIGNNATCSSSGGDNIAIGRSASITGTATQSIAIGGTSTTSSDGTTVVGFGASGGGTGATVYGKSAITVSGTDVAIFGANANSAASTSQVTICGNAATNPVTGSNGNTLLGYNASGPAVTASTSSTAVGANAAIENSVANRFYIPIATAANTALIASAASINVTNGRLFAVTSSLRYKQNLEALAEPARVLGLVAKTYNAKPGHCGHPELPDANGWVCDGLCRREVGLIAEEVAEVIPEVVAMSKDPDTGADRCESVQYDRVAVFLLEVVKTQQTALTAQAATIAAQEATLAAQAETIADCVARLTSGGL